MLSSFGSTDTDLPSLKVDTKGSTVSSESGVGGMTGRVGLKSSRETGSVRGAGKDIRRSRRRMTLGLVGSSTTVKVVRSWSSTSLAFLTASSQADLIFGEATIHRSVKSNRRAT